MADDTADDRATGEVPPEADHPERGGGFLAVVRETVIVVVLSLLIATLVRIFLVQAFLIPSQSMEQTLLVGDRVLVSKLTTRFGEVERGDVVVFEDPGGWLGPMVQPPSSAGLAATLRDGLEFVGVLPDDAEGHLIKRVVALGGDTVACCDDQGRLTVNGVPIDEAAYLYPGDAASTTEFEEVVPPGAVWVMGDHRSNSGDSRVHGTVPEDRITGRAFAVVWPASRWQGLGRPDAFEAVPEP
ncbi:MAG TPA: signal peptidase I [Jiangellales bacterium]|nr:signal peptidase I [Jiangellales bacterium]